jgi:predicted nuclease of predicted toxin-antitoxin system
VVALLVKFLLDANLSPRVARFLIEQFQLDVATLQGQGLGELPDHEVIKLARQQGRVIITLDQDYSDYFLAAPRQPIGIIHLDLPSRLRYIPAINRLLADFFTRHAATIALEQSLVVIREDSVVIHHGA